MTEQPPHEKFLAFRPRTARGIAVLILSVCVALLSMKAVEPANAYWHATAGSLNLSASAVTVVQPVGVCEPVDGGLLGLPVIVGDYVSIDWATQPHESYEYIVLTGDQLATPDTEWLDVTPPLFIRAGLLESVVGALGGLLIGVDRDSRVQIRAISGSWKSTWSDPVSLDYNAGILGIVFAGVDCA